MAKLIEKKKSQTTYQIELHGDELNAILVVYGKTSYDFYKEKGILEGRSVLSKNEYYALYNSLRQMVHYSK